MLSQGIDTLFQYQVLGVFAAIMLVTLGYILKFLLKELREILREIHAITKGIKDILGDSNQSTILYERNRSKECFEKIISTLQKNHIEVIEAIYYKKCTECNGKT